MGALGRASRGSPDEVWGAARQRQRDEVLNVLKTKFPERYRELLEQYYKSLQEGDRAGAAAGLAPGAGAER